VRKGSTNRTAHIVKRFHTFVKNTINVVLKKMKEKTKHPERFKQVSYYKTFPILHHVEIEGL